jgi:hypothetical protein
MKLKLSHRGYSRFPEDKVPKQLELNLEPYIPLSPKVRGPGSARNRTMSEPSGRRRINSKRIRNEDQ